HGEVTPRANTGNYEFVSKSLQCCGSVIEPVPTRPLKRFIRLRFDNRNATVNNDLITERAEGSVFQTETGNPSTSFFERTTMTYTTRRARIEAEKAELIALRSRRNKKFSMGVAGLATAASASIFGMAPANAAIEDVPAQSSTTSSSTTSS